MGPESQFFQFRQDKGNSKQDHNAPLESPC